MNRAKPKESKDSRASSLDAFSERGMRFTTTAVNDGPGGAERQPGLNLGEAPR